MHDYKVSFAFVHHANQYLITDGYKNRSGISSVVGKGDSDTGFLRVLDLHKRYHVPLNLHISGTLLESLAWNCPECLEELDALKGRGLLEIIGSSYGQNMMRFFSPEHNTRQLREELALVQNLIGWDPKMVRTFWVPERLWDTVALSPVLTDSRLQNGGYRYVVLDDRLFYGTEGDPSPRRVYDHEQTWNPDNFRMHRVRNGHGLNAIPISRNLRQNIPPRNPKQYDKVKDQLYWLLDLSAHQSNGLIALYADDMEKPAGVGWDTNGPSQFEEVLRWVSAAPWIHTVKISDWAKTHTPAEEKNIDTGSYFELASEFDAGEGFDSWYHGPKWVPYKAQFEWSERRVREVEAQGGDKGLLDLAWKILMATSWQTAWHTPKTGAHGERHSDVSPSAWVKAIASHSRVAPIVAEAASWSTNKTGQAEAYLQDIDQDGNQELILKNETVFTVVSPSNGGRIVYLASIAKPPGRLVVGNPIDDWNLLEGLHEYMDVPPNHPGALADFGFEHDRYGAEIVRAAGSEVRVTLRNNLQGSTSPLEKTLVLEKSQPAVRVEYTLPESVKSFSTEVGLSPDYLQLLRSGKKSLRQYSPIRHVRGWVNGNVAGWVTHDDNSEWGNPRQESFGHGHFLRVTAATDFTMWVGGGPV